MKEKNGMTISGFIYCPICNCKNDEERECCYRCGLLIERMKLGKKKRLKYK